VNDFTDVGADTAEISEAVIVEPTTITITEVKTFVDNIVESGADPTGAVSVSQLQRYLKMHEPASSS
jgi:hypothetical protein